MKILKTYLKIKIKALMYRIKLQGICKSTLCEKYESEEPTDYEILNNDHSHPPDVTFQYVDYCKKNIKVSIESDPLQPVLKKK